MNIGDKFPDLLGVDAEGKDVRLSDFPDKKFIIYFYPKDNTSGCTLEAVSLRDNYRTFLDMGYQIIGVSKDSEASREAVSSVPARGRYGCAVMRESRSLGRKENGRQRISRHSADHIHLRP